VRIGGSAMRLRCCFVLFRRLVVFFFHGAFSLSAEEYRLGTLTAPIVAAPSAKGVVSKWARGNRNRFGAVPSDCKQTYG
jgi:hypothetical protein